MEVHIVGVKANRANGVTNPVGIYLLKVNNKNARTR